MNRLAVYVYKVRVTMTWETLQRAGKFVERSRGFENYFGFLVFSFILYTSEFLLTGIWHLNKRLLLWYANRMYGSKYLSLGMLKGQFTIYKDGKAQ